MTPERLAIIKRTLDRRQPDLTVMMDNVIKPHNLAAVARTLESVGGMEIHAITELSRLRLSQMSAGGVRRWIKVIKHPTIDDGIAALKEQGMQVVATVLSESAVDFTELDYTVPTAVLVGEELEGISDRAIELADHHVTIPMAGMVQSLNVSVATALVLYEAYRQRMQAGLYDARRLDEASYERLLFEAVHAKVAHYCRNHDLPYPAIDEDAELLEPIADSTTHSDISFSEWTRKHSD